MVCFVNRLISECFAAKGDLEVFLKVEAYEYVKLMNAVYDRLVEDDLR